MAPLIISYAVGDGATYSADVVVPVDAESKEAFADAFDTAMAAYEPGRSDLFSISGQVFEYRHFVHWTEASGSAPRTYDCVGPEVQTVEEWSAACRSRSARILSDRRDAFEVPSDVSSSSVPRI